MTLEQHNRQSSRRRKRPLSSIASAASASVALFSSSAASMMTHINGDSINNNPQGVACGPSLQCFNGGSCQQGDASWPTGEFDSSTMGSNEVGLLPSTLQQTNQEGYFCACVSNSNTGEYFTGLSCEIPYRECQYSSGVVACYHGGSCLDHDLPNQRDNSAVCDCTTAHYDGLFYAGRHCELSTNPCQDGISPPYCLNGGTCEEPKFGRGDKDYCTCVGGYSGARCETPPAKGGPTQIAAMERLNNDSSNSSSDCTLECHHGGTCQFASGEVTGDFGTLQNMFCECPEGFAGVQCEHLAQVCGDAQELICLHGSKCQQQDDNSWSCACPENTSRYNGGVCTSLSTLSDGAIVDHTRVTHCSPVEEAEYAHSMAVPALCFNGGTCRDQMVDGLLMPACDCPPAFTGPHCEFVRSASDGLGPGGVPPPDNNNDNDGSRHFGRRFMNAILVTLFALGLLWLARYGYRAYQKLKRRDEVVLNLQSFREENQGAVSANGSMLFPSMNNANPNQHRAGDNQFTLAELMHDVEIT